MGPDGVKAYWFAAAASAVSAELRDVVRELAFEVGSLVFRDCVLRSKTVKHCCENLELSLSLNLVGHLAKIAHGVAGSLGIVTIAGAA